MDQSHDADHRHAPEDSAAFEVTCPRCGTTIPLAGQSPLDREPPGPVFCPSCGYELRPTSHPDLA